VTDDNPPKIVECFTASIDRKHEKSDLFCVEQAGGFTLPFISLGSLLFVVGVISYFVLPPQNGNVYCTAYYSRRTFKNLRIL